jgi:hypothetical protein
MSIKYSPSNNAFYDTDINTVIPTDVIEISREQHNNLLESQSSGKEIYAQADCTPGTRNIVPIITWDDIRAQRNALLASSDWIDLPNSPLNNKHSWLEYRQTLRNIPQHHSHPSQVVWPLKP